MGIVLNVAAISAGIGIVIGLLRAEDGAFGEAMFAGALTGGFIGLACSVVEYLFLSNVRFKFTRRLPPVALGAVRAIIFGVIIVFGLTAPVFVVEIPLPWRDPDFFEMFAISAGIATAMSIGIEVARLLGSEATFALFSGRYHRPRLEDRVVLFADLVGSTALAERIGDLRFHTYLQDVALDLAGPIEQARGNVYRYVGDAVIVTWPLGKGVQNAVCLTCAMNMHQVLEQRAASYLHRFGSEARLRVSLHCGHVAAGEIGDWKKEIALLGDTMNTAARIESAAKIMGEATVLSDALVQQLPEETRSNLRPLPPYAAAGKSERLKLWATSRRDA